MMNRFKFLGKYIYWNSEIKKYYVTNIPKKETDFPIDVEDDEYVYVTQNNFKKIKNIEYLCLYNTFCKSNINR